MSSASRDRVPVGAERDESPVSHHSQDTELIEQLQLELEEARRTIRSHETKILALQDEVEAARESCMEEECERVEAEIAKERVHNENRMLKVQLSELEMQKSSGGSDETTPTDALSRSRRPLSALEPLTLNTIAIQTDDSALRSVKSMGDVIAVQPKINHVASLEKLQESTVENLLSDVEEADGLLIPMHDRAVAIPFRQKTVPYKVSVISHWLQSCLIHQNDFSGSLYKDS